MRDQMVYANEFTCSGVRCEYVLNMAHDTYVYDLLLYYLIRIILLLYYKCYMCEYIT